MMIKIKKNKCFNKIIYIKYFILILLLLFIVIKFLVKKSKIIKNLNLLKNNNESMLTNKKYNKKINFGIYSFSLRNGGIERLTALLLNYLSKEKIFNIYLLTKLKKSIEEYSIDNNVKRIYINDEKNLKIYLIKYKIKVFVYQSYKIKIMKMLNNIKEVKTIFYNHSCFFFWMYIFRNNFIIKLYSTYKKLKYIISIVPFENDYLFKKWGINSIFMNNLITYNKRYDKIIPSDLSSKIILMIGRGSDHLKRFHLGIKSMTYIRKEIPDSKMLIISKLDGLRVLINLVEKLNLKNNIEFVGYTKKPEIFFKNASLHIIPSICESFSMVLCETKMFGIPNILLGIDYVSAGKGGVINIYDDNPETIAKEAIKILNNYKYRKELGKIAIESMKTFNNEITIKKWIQLIFAVYKGDKYYTKLKENNKKISKKEAINYLKRQIKIFKMRKPEMKNLTLNNIINFNFSF